MTDRELLELAAKAAGMKVIWSSDWILRNCTGMDRSANIFSAPEWRPLTDDGDALRLAVELWLTVAVRHNECEVFEDGGDCLTSEPIFTASAFVKPEQATNPAEATRRAIVCAAAEIGKGMP